MSLIDLWYKNAIIYSLDVETFADGNGDGIGDFHGLKDKLDYLSGLNVNTVWLLPFYPTPNRDNGYDVTDFYGVDPRLGTLGDFVEFSHQAQDRGIRILTDLVVNHTSNEHPWFQSARSDPDSPYRDFYVWSKEKPEDAHEGMVFPGKQDAVWTFDEMAGEWYFHRFYSHQPDLNVSNPKVREEISRIMGFWLQLGVSGFRVDALPFLIELRGTDAEGKQDPYEYLREFRNFLSFRRGDAVMLAEANLPPDQVLDYVGDGDKIQLMFNFWANQHLFLALARGEAGPIRQAYEELPDIPEMCQWANFVRTHDELDLGRLSDEERQEVFAQFAPEKHMQLYDRGIRRRLAPMLKGNRRWEQMVNSLMLSLPGTPVLRYGDEIGMGDDLSLEERISVRTPMQWTDERNAGFSSAPEDKLIHPVITKEPFHYRDVNVEKQAADPESMLSWTERMLRVRRECKEFGWGKCEFLDVAHPAVLAHRCVRNGSSIMAVHNFSDADITVELQVDGLAVLHDLLTKAPQHVSGKKKLKLELGPYGYRWFREEKEQGQ